MLPAYLDVYLTHPGAQNWIVLNGRNSVIDAAGVGVVSRLPVALPPLAEQSALAEAITALDDAIALHAQIHTTLLGARNGLVQALVSPQGDDKNESQTGQEP